jgi:hypothetical protein
LTLALIACYMFGRWVQENFFRYLRQDYALDKIVQYSVDEVDKNIMVVNREYSNIQYDVKRCREKLYRLKANIYNLQQKALKEYDNKKKDDSDDTKKNDSWFLKTLNLVEKAQQFEQELSELIKKRSGIKSKIPISEMPEKERYTKLHQESKYLMNILKMICYRAETALANKLAPHFSRSDDEIRALVKASTHLSIDLIPDYKNSLLNITLYPLSNQRSINALAKIIEEVNATNTVYPDTMLIMRFKNATMTVAPSQEF